MINIEKFIETNTIVIFSKPSCKYCTKSYDLLNNNNIEYYKFDVGELVDNVEFDEIYNKLQLLTNKAKTYPMIFIEQKFIGGYNELQLYVKNIELSKAIEDTNF